MTQKYLFLVFLFFLIIKTKASKIDLDTVSQTDSHRYQLKEKGKACSKICVSKHIKSLSKKINGKGGVGRKGTKSQIIQDINFSHTVSKVMQIYLCRKERKKEWQTHAPSFTCV